MSSKKKPYKKPGMSPAPGFPSHNKPFGKLIKGFGPKFWVNIDYKPKK